MRYMYVHVVHVNTRSPLVVGLSLSGVEAPGDNVPDELESDAAEGHCRHTVRGGLKTHIFMLNFKRIVDINKRT